MTGDNPTEATLTTGATFHTNKAKSNVPVVTLSLNDNIKFLENLKQGFRRKVFWNKSRSETTTQPKNNNLDVLSLKNGDDDPTRNSFDEYYMSLVGSSH